MQRGPSEGGACWAALLTVPLPPSSQRQVVAASSTGGEALPVVGDECLEQSTIANLSRGRQCGGWLLLAAWGTVQLDEACGTSAGCVWMGFASVATSPTPFPIGAWHLNLCLGSG